MVVRPDEYPSTDRPGLETDSNNYLTFRLPFKRSWNLTGLARIAIASITAFTPWNAARRFTGS